MNDSPPVPPEGANPKFDQWAKYWSEQLQRLGTHQGAYFRTRAFWWGEWLDMKASKDND